LANGATIGDQIMVANLEKSEGDWLKTGFIAKTSKLVDSCLTRIKPLANSDFCACKTDSLDEGLLCNEEDGNDRQGYHQ